jgi:hypothetical protein
MADTQILCGGYPTYQNCERYSSSGDAWTTRNNMIASSFDGGGFEWDGSAEVQINRGNGQQVYLYNDAGNSWSSLGNHPIDQYQVGRSNESGNYGYQYNGAISGNTPQQLVYKYDRSVDSWTNLGNLLPVARRYSDTAWAGDADQVYCISGITPVLNPTTEVDKYVISTSTGSVANPVTNGSLAFGCAGEGNQGAATYIIKGGQTGINSEVFNAPAGTWSAGGANVTSTNNARGFAAGGNNYQALSGSAWQVTYAAGVWAAITGPGWGATAYESGTNTILENAPYAESGAFPLDTELPVLTSITIDNSGQTSGKALDIIIDI